MKYLRIPIFLVLFSVGFLVIWFYLKDQKVGLASPVLGISKERFSDNIWFPKMSDQIADQFVEAPEISANSALFVETNSDEVLYQKNPHTKASIASLTKIMSVIVALEFKTPEDVYSVSFRASEMEPDKMLLIAGERLTLRELMDGIFLVSANDAAEVIAEGTTGRREEFINLMNSKAAQLGMKDSYFVNPTGLEEEAESCGGRTPCAYSSAFDVLLMARYLTHRWSEIVDISSQPHIFIEANSNHQDYDLYSGINLLTTYPGVVGLKTGYTPEAGLTLVTMVRRDGKEVLGVLLGSTDRRDDAKALLDYSFKKLGVSTP